MGMGVIFRLGVWNVMWAKAGTECGEAVRRALWGGFSDTEAGVDGRGARGLQREAFFGEAAAVHPESREGGASGPDPAAADRWRAASRIGREGFDVICLTEGTLGLFPEDGYVIDSDPDYGYRMIDGRRKVLLWSRHPWREVDRVGDPAMPGGRFVSGVTETPVGDVRVVWVCIPWEGAHADTGRKNRAKWEDHLRYLEGLERYLAGLRVREDRRAEIAGECLLCGGGSARPGPTGGSTARDIPVVVAGDFNQTIPRTRARADAYEALTRAFEGWDVVTAGLGGIDHVALDGRLRALRVKRWEVEYGAASE